jgi:flagellar protein FliO/FliZ
MFLRLIIGVPALAAGLHATTSLALAAAASERTPLDLGSPSAQQTHLPSGGGGGIVRTLVGLVVVLLVIWGLSWVLRQIKASREERSSGRGLASLASLPLGPGRSVHVVRVGREVLLLGSSEHEITALGRYTEDEADRAGLIGPDAPDDLAAPALRSRTIVDVLRDWTVRR